MGLFGTAGLPLDSRVSEALARRAFRHFMGSLLSPSKAQTILVTALLLCALSLQCSWAQEEAIAPAVAALQRGDYPSAEQILKARLSAQPKDGEALGILAIVLDQEQRYGEADVIYRRALGSSPPDPALLNNFGNHLLASGTAAEARKVFLRVIALEAENANALVQLARISLERKAPGEALGYLNRVRAALQDRPDAVILRMQANYQLGRRREGDAILAKISASAFSNFRQSFALGVALASAGQYEKAEGFFSKTLEADPANFEAVYDLGLAASHAGHNERARSALEQAIAQQPQNVNVLYDLAAVNVALDRKEAALESLAKASRLAPQRTDVLQLEARTSAALGYFADARNAWDEYLKLVPGDDVARRERAFAQTATGEKMEEALGALNTFVRRHPADPVGHYELGTAEATPQPNDALQELNRALLLKPDLTAAHGARGLLLYQQGKAEAALADFQFVAQKEPNNGTILDRLGETYLSLDRPDDALPLLRKAAELLPSNSTVLLRLGRALSKTGQEQEATAVFARCRELGPNRSASPHPAGLVEFLGLSPEEQNARYRAGVEHTVQNHPDNAEAQVRYLGILLKGGDTAAASPVVRTLGTLKLSTPLLTQAASTLLDASQYSLAKQLLDQNRAAASPEVCIDRAVAELHVTGAQAGLDALSSIPLSQQNGDYYLARAQMLVTQDRSEDAEISIQKATALNPTRSDLYRQAALFWVKNHRLSQALQLLIQAARTVPNDPELSLLHAITLELIGSHTNADSEFKQLETRWPAWYKVWTGNALVLEARGRHAEAETMRQAASALGAPSNVANVGRQAGFTSVDLGTALPVLFP